MSLRTTFELVLTSTLVVCALITTGAVVHRYLRPSVASSGESSSHVFIRDWRSHLAKGQRLGPANARVQLMEFGDFQCPYCAIFHSSVKAMRSRYPTELSVIYVHYPLPIHQLAEAAAMASECAGEQGRFEPMQDRLFEQQRLIGSKPWLDFAREAGVGNLRQFERCIQDVTYVTRVAAGRQLGDLLGILGTPTIVINGWKLRSPPTADQLDRMITAVIHGESPIAAR